MSSEFTVLDKNKLTKFLNHRTFVCIYNAYFKSCTCSPDRLKRDINLYMALLKYFFPVNLFSIFSVVVMLQNETPDR